ncbi:hypothetical protein JCM19379_28830 [Methyloparacoccus murrellii]|jgi:hypothetical protein
MLFGSNRPVTGKASTVIHRPVDEVFRFVGDDFLVNYPRWSPEVVDLRRLSEGPIRVGSLLRQVRIDHGHKSESSFRVTDYLPNRRLAFDGVSNAYRCIYDFEVFASHVDEGEATRLAFTFEFPELELILRPFEKLVRVAVQDGAERTVRNLKGLIEREAARV